MQEVWFLFKILEAILGSCAMGFHIQGFLDIEPLNHNLIYCGTFFGFTIIALFGNISICVRAGPTPLMEALVNAFAAFMYIFCSLMTMYQAEKDFHLMYLSDFEEPLHPFFRYSKAQSITALAAGSLHLMHSVFAFDVIIIKDDFTMGSMDSDFEDDTDDPIQPIQLYIFGKTIHRKLQKFKWFRRLSDLPDDDMVYP